MYVCIYIYIYTHVCMYVCMYVYIYIYIYMCIYTYICCIHIYIYICYAAHRAQHSHFLLPSTQAYATRCCVDYVCIYIYI